MKTWVAIFYDGAQIIGFSVVHANTKDEALKHIDAELTHNGLTPYHQDPYEVREVPAGDVLRIWSPAEP